MFGFNEQEVKFLRRLNSPVKIQNYLESIKINFGDTCMSPRMVLRKRKAHCMEGAMLATAALWINGEWPLVLDLRSARFADPIEIKAGKLVKERR